MNRLTTTLLAVACTATLLLHTNAAEAQGASTDLHVGVGLGSTFGTSSGIPIGASIDFPVTDNITVGGLFAFQRFGSTFGSDFSVNVITFGARGAYHLTLDQLPAELDPYGGIMLAYQRVSFPGFDDFLGINPFTNRFFPGLFVGANYNFSERLGAFAELGYSVAYLTVGLNVNL